MDATEIANKMRRLHDLHRLGHAYILLGESLTVLRQTAHQIVQGLYCSRVSPSGDACQTCDECLRIASGNHLGMTWIAPDGASLKIAQMRSAWSADTRKASGVTLRMIVVEDAQKLTVEATNAILKWVEEPGENRLFLFLTVSLAALLPTLRSRCALLRIDKNSLNLQETDDDGLFALWPNKEEEDGDFAKVQAQFADALSLVLELGQSLATQEPHGWHAVADRFAKMNFKAEQGYAIVDLLIAYFRDLIAVSCSQPVSHFRAQIRQLQHVAKGEQIDHYARIAVELGALRRRLSSHVQVATALEAVFLQFQRESA
ncbi:hypothetical protein [Sulfoacidibacillus thermotolerans]|uniref:DNA polymerase III subunit delta n=1 Tax=Sulfoacidibacillus thermotolerans TaxID=1765684 RepID=A0A2U3D8C1_SULT2|nr:hypothetical protein [Sulfoacidibacillus thermotolerans]PWI57527.1 hypothetical protein BM613_07815 [Sulfoacidibacillus thermotolerans]